MQHVKEDFGTMHVQAMNGLIGTKQVKEKRTDFSVVVLTSSFGVCGKGL